MIYLVTGVVGFIASKAAELLLNGGHIVHGIDNMKNSYDVRLKEWRLKQLDAYPGFRFHPEEICDRPTLVTLFAGFDAQPQAVNNLATRAGGSGPSRVNPVPS